MDPEDFDFGDYGSEQPQQQAPPPIPEPWTQGDTNRLNQLNGGLSVVDEQVGNGELHPDTGMELKQRLMAMRQPLLQKQEATKAQMQQEQRGMMQDELAHAEAVQHQSAVYRA